MSYQPSLIKNNSYDLPCMGQDLSLKKKNSENFDQKMERLTCLSYNSYDVNSENLVLDQLENPQTYIFFLSSHHVSD